jgi:hypothetical protein
LVIGLFLNTTMHRAQQAWALPDLIPHDTPDRVHRIQSFAPPGERILVWIKTPQHLEFDRNDLFLVYQSGLVTPWLDFPSEATPQSADVFFRRYGIRYLLRERMERDFPSGDNDINGMHGSRLAYFHRMGRRFAMLRSMIMVAERHHKALYDDGRTVLTDLTR